MMKKKYFLLAGLVATGLYPTVASAQEEDVTSAYIVNADFEDAMDDRGPYAKSSTMSLYAPTGWTAGYTDDATGADWQHFTSAPYSTDNPPIGGESLTENNWSTPYLEPTGGIRYYMHAFSNSGRAKLGKPRFYLEQTLSNLPAGMYRLEADGAMLSQDDNGWWQSDGFKYALRVQNPKWNIDNEAIYTIFAAPGFAQDEDITADAAMEKQTIEFFVAADNEPVTIGVYFTAGTDNWCHQIYIDNFKLYRTGEANPEAVAEAINAETDAMYGFLETEMNDALGSYAPEGWADQILAVIDGIYDNTTVESAMAARETLAKWKNDIETLANLRSELNSLNESANELMNKGYAGLPAFMAAIKASTDLYNQTPGADIAAVESMVSTMEKAIEDYIMSALPDATPEAPVDVTYYFVNNPGIDVNDSEVTGWTVENFATNWGNKYEDETANNTTYFDIYNATSGAGKAKASQTITELPAGTYRLKAWIAQETGMNGAYIFAESGGIYYSTESTGTGYFKEYEVEDIYVLDGTLTIGTTTKGDELWGGNPYTGTWTSCDDFVLEYCGPDVSGISSILGMAIDEANDQLYANEEVMLKGDVAEIKAAIAGAEAELDKTEIDPAVLASILPIVKGTASICSSSVAALENIETKIDEATPYTTDATYSEESRTALTKLIADINTWKTSETAVYTEAQGHIDNLKKHIQLVKQSVLDAVTPENSMDATFLIVNADLAQGSTGWTMENTNVAWWGAPKDWFLEAIPHLCYWQSRVTPGAAFNYYQILKDIPNGTYILEAKGCYSAAWGSDDSEYPNKNAVIYAIGATEQQTPMTSMVMILNDAEEAPEEAYEDGTGVGNRTYNKYINDPRPVDYKIEGIKVTNGTLTIGMKSIGELNATTARAYGWKLTCVERNIETGIEEIEATDNVKVTADNGYIQVEGADDYQVYNSASIEVNANAQLSAGIYFVKVGNKTYKVLVK